MTDSNGLLSPEFLANPYPMLKLLRDQAPLAFIEPMNMYVAVGYDAARAILMDPRRFSSIVNIPSRSVDEANRIVNEEGYGRGRPALQNNDQPLHTSYRALVNEAFRPKRIRQMEDYVEGIVAELIDAIVEAGGEADVVHDFSVPLPLIVISDQLGVPREMYRTFKEWSDAWLAGLGTELTDEQHIANAHTVIEMQKYLAGRIEERRATPQDDILSDLAQADVNGGKLDTATILSIVEQLLVAGNETTTNGIAAGLYALSQDQDLHRRLREDSALVGEFVEEVLRMESPVQGLFRRATEDTEVEGVAIPEGSIVMVHYGAANRDEDRFAQAEAFDLDRPKKGAHIAFGSGIHHCGGSELARVEMRVCFAAFVSRFSQLELLDPDIVYHPTFALRGIQRLNLRLVP